MPQCKFLLVNNRRALARMHFSIGPDMSALIDCARSFLFVPASRPELYGKALNSGSNCIVVDLEDAVAAELKADARTKLAHALTAFTRGQLMCTLVRVNGSDTQWHGEDLRLIAEWVAKGLGGVMVPKAESAALMRGIGIALGPAARLVPLVESLAGFDAADLLARTPQVRRLAFGHLDFQLDLRIRCSPEESELAPVRFGLVAASRRAHLPAPIDGVTTDTVDSERLDTDTRRSRGFGFGGKLCIHPSQVAAVNQAFGPSQQELEWARRVIEAAHAHEGHAFSLDGQMIDLPVVRLAEQTLQAA